MAKGERASAIRWPRVREFGYKGNGCKGQGSKGHECKGTHHCDASHRGTAKPGDSDDSNPPTRMLPSRATRMLPSRATRMLPSRATLMLCEAI